MSAVHDVYLAWDLFRVKGNWKFLLEDMDEKKKMMGKMQLNTFLQED